MELFVLMAGLALALVVFAAVFRRTSSRSARALPAVPNIEVRDRAVARSMLVDHADTFSDRPVSPFHVKFVRTDRVNLSYSISTVPHGARSAATSPPASCTPRASASSPASSERPSTASSPAFPPDAAPGEAVTTTLSSSSATACTPPCSLTLQMRMCFGDGGFDAHDVRAVQQVLKDFFDGMVDAPVLATSRTARLLHWRRWRRFLGVRSRMTKLLLPLIVERRRRRQSSYSGDDGDGIRPYVDSLLDVQVPSYDDGSVKRALTDDEKVNLVWEFIGAGTETVVSCVEWTLAHLVNQPEVQEKLRREVDVHGIGSDRREVAVDTPYLRAVILESLRLHPPVAVIQRDVVVGSVDDGPAAAVIGVHVPLEEDGISGVVRFTVVPGAIGRDSRTWTDADEFRPERFLAGGEGEAVGPMPRSKDVRMLPFGAGTRHCPGMGLGMVHVRLLLAALVRGFQWELLPAATGALVDLTEVDGFVKHMKTPLMARITSRM